MTWVRFPYGLLRNKLNLTRKETIQKSETDDKPTNKALEPDGQATGCNPVKMGSIPIGVSDTKFDDPTAGLDYILQK